MDVHPVDRFSDFRSSRSPIYFHFEGLRLPQSPHGRCASKWKWIGARRTGSFEVDFRPRLVYPLQVSNFRSPSYSTPSRPIADPRQGAPMSILRHLRRHLPHRQQVQRLATKMSGTCGDPIRRNAVETAVDATVDLTDRSLRRLLPTFEHRLTPRRVEKKYDAMAGKYIHINIKDNERRGVYWIDGRLQEVRRVEFERRFLDEHAEALGRHRFGSLLEVGAGELTTLTGIAERIGDRRAYHGIDLSFRRIHRGARYFAARNLDIVAARASALALPYGDNSFDVVFSSHCLEHIPAHFPLAIDEMIRVARRAVLLFEPSFERGGPLQKFRMLANGYVRGIEDYLSTLSGVTLSRPRLLENASAYNRTALYEIRPHRSPATAHPVHAAPGFACPTCSTSLRRAETTYRCHHCERAHPIIDGIADLGVDTAYSIFPAAVRHSSRDVNWSTISSGTTQGFGY